MVSLMARAVLLMVALMASPALGVYFEITEGKERCFIEEVPIDTLVVVKYDNLDFAKMTAEGDHRAAQNPQAYIQMIVKDPRQEHVQNINTEEKGQLAFTSLTGGEHRICLKTSTSSWFGTIRTFRFSMQVTFGEHATDYQEVAKQEHLSAIEVEIRKLNDKIRGIRAEQDYQRMREEAFRDTSESTNARVMWWSLLQTLVLLVSGAWQIASLKSFFKEKKLA